MSDTTPANPDGAKKGGKKKWALAFIAVCILAGGGGAVGYYYAGAHGGPAVDPNAPRLMQRGEAQEAAEAEKGKDGPLIDHRLNGKNIADTPKDKAAYQLSYLALEGAFTSNLNQSDQFVQIGIGVATYYDQRVLDNVRAHEMALRSQSLLLLSQEDGAYLATSDGKRALQLKLARSFNQVLREKTGFGGIDNIYFTSFVVQ